jgi:hypothetical protein
MRIDSDSDEESSSSGSNKEAGGNPPNTNEQGEVAQQDHQTNPGVPEEEHIDETVSSDEDEEHGPAKGIPAVAETAFDESSSSGK